MSGTQTIDKERLDRMLVRAVEEKQRLILTHHSPQGWRTFKAHFVKSVPASRTLVIQTHLSRDLPDAALPREREVLGVTFRSGHKKSMFASNVESIKRQGNHGMVSLHWPDQIKQMQRRAYERVEPPRNAAIAVRLWQAGDPREPITEDRVVRYGQLVDLSAGGMRVKVADVSDFEPSAVYRCVFSPKPGKPTLCADAFVRHQEAADADHGRACVGFQFVGLETSTQGRRTLDCLAQTVSQFQRADTRRRS